MGILDAVKRLLGVKPMDVGELNRRATLRAARDAPRPAAVDPLAGIIITEEYLKVRKIYDSQQDQIVARVVGAYTQYPLMLAWAVTIHKAQGKTLDNVLIDLGDGAFTFGQVYVALSRCRRIDGIRLARQIRESEVRCDPVIKRFYQAMADMSKADAGESPEH